MENPAEHSSAVKAGYGVLITKGVRNRATIKCRSSRRNAVTGLKSAASSLGRHRSSSLLLLSITVALAETIHRRVLVRGRVALAFTDRAGDGIRRRNRIVALTCALLLLRVGTESRFLRLLLFRNPTFQRA